MILCLELGVTSNTYYCNYFNIQKSKIQHALLKTTCISDMQARMKFPNVIW